MVPSSGRLSMRDVGSMRAPMVTKKSATKASRMGRTRASVSWA